MNIKLHFDDIIYNMQRQGGISRYWQEMTSRVSLSKKFHILRSQDSKFFRYFPVPTSCQIFHSSYYRNSLGKKTKRVVTVHDFLYQYGIIQTSNSLFHMWQMSLSINSADAIICVSENTKRDLLLFYPNLKEFPNIYVIPHGSNINSAHISKLQTSKFILKIKNLLENPYILFVGKRLKYKNFESALLGFSESLLPKLGYSMICIGSEFDKEELSRLRQLGLQERVFTLCNLKNSEMLYLYQNAFALVYPSLYEGFGIPPLEAMNLGCPVIASNSTSIPEVVGDAGILINPHESREIAYALDVLQDDNVRSEYINKGQARARLFTWEKAAQKHIEVYQSLIYGHL
jgi:mannosyltransferase